MNESLTVPGLIATLLSIVFAVAAFYIAHRRQVRNQSTQTLAHTPVPTFPQPADVATTAYPLPTLPQPAQPTPTRNGAPAHTAPVPTPDLAGASGGTTPLFKKLGNRGVEEVPLPIADDNKYAWE